MEGNINMIFTVPHGGRNIIEGTHDQSFFQILCKPCIDGPS